MGNYRVLLVPHDFSAQADAALLLAVDMAERLGAEVQLLHVVQTPTFPALLAPDGGGVVMSAAGLCEDARGSLQRVADAASGAARGPLAWKVIEAPDIAEGIRGVAQSAHADLIVMGTHGRTGLRALLGNVAEQTLRCAPCPVVSIRVPAEGRAALPASMPSGTSPASAMMETLTEAIARLVKDGFDKSFQARSGSLICLETEQAFEPRNLRVCETVRFEGDSDPGDGTVLIALRSADGLTAGTLVAGYGTSTDSESAEVVASLDTSHRAPAPPIGQAVRIDEELETNGRVRDR